MWQLPENELEKVLHEQVSWGKDGFDEGNFFICGWEPFGYHPNMGGYPGLHDRCQATTRVKTSLGANYWNACLDILSRPLDSLDAVQRPAARVFEYYGRVMNGGHSLHFDVHGDSRDEELLRALKELGATSHVCILAEAFFLRHEAKRRKSEEDYVSESIEELDMQFGRLSPDIPELLAQYFKAHPESFPV